MNATHAEPTPADLRLVIAASAAGTVFEWYDFFIYGTLGTILSKAFFPTGNATLELLLFWLVFAVGFGFRPLGAVLFGFLGDRLGRKYTFLATVALMGVATAGVGLVPSAASIGYTAPALVILLRVAQGLALGGEYGGAAVYVAEHSAPGRRGFFTSFIQAGVVGGFILSLVVVLACKAAFGPAIWAAWGWRVPFVLSLGLLAISLWMRMKLSESPVFQAMKAENELAGNPFVESFTAPGNRKRLLVALFGIAAGLTVIWYTAMFSSLTFLKTAMRMNETAAEVIVGIAALFGVGSFLLFGHLSDKIGRKAPIVWGYLATLVLLFPLYWGIGALANPRLARQARELPVVVSGPDCQFDAFAADQPGACGKLLSDLTATGVSYRLERAPVLTLHAGAARLPLDAYPWADKKARGKALEGLLAKAGYNLDRITPTPGRAALVVLMLIGLMALSGATYGPVAAVLCEMFPPRIRYSSLSIPYHIGTGYFGGFLPFLSTLIIAKTGDPYAGLWYTWVVVLVAFLVSMWGLKGGLPQDEPA